MKRILMILASEQFRDIEYLVPRAFFEQHGCDVTTTSSTKTSKGKFGYEVKNDLLISEANSSMFDGVYMVGGLGSLEYIENKTAQQLVESFYKSGKPVSAICAAPRNFLHWGLLKGKKATGFNGDQKFEPLALEKGAVPMPEKTVILDGGILTANGPAASEESALEFLKMLGNV